ncbi:MAG: hypothetical protein JSV77_09700, partial [Dehalococcoidales bacterium]
LSEIVVTKKESPPPPPPDAEIIGLVYDFGPEGASFDQAVTIRLSYDDTQIPEGVSEEQLIIAIWYDYLQEWVRLDTTVDPINNIVTSEVTHFTTYTIIAHTRPAAFTVSNLIINPPEAAADERIDVSVLVSNTGDLTGIYQLELKVDGEVAVVKSAHLDGNKSVTVPFSLYWDTGGIHTVTIAGLSETFTIDTGEPTTPDTVITTNTVIATPIDIANGESVAIRVMITNTSSEQDKCRVSLKKDNILVETKEVTLDGGASQPVIFTILKETAASYTVEIRGPAGVFTAEDTPLSIPQVPTPTPPTATLNWWLIGGSIAAGIIIGLVVAVIIARRKTQIKASR